MPRYDIRRFFLAENSRDISQIVLILDTATFASFSEVFSVRGEFRLKKIEVSALNINNSFLYVINILDTILGFRTEQNVRVVENCTPGKP